jgi:hypothetical protein
MFCAPGLIFGITEGVRYCFHVLLSRTCFSAVPRVSGPGFIFCSPGHVFDGLEGVSSRFLVLRSRTRFRRYGGRRVPFSCFARPNSFSTVSRTSGTVLMFCTPGHVFDGTEGVGTRFHVLCALTRFWRKQGCRVSFSCFALSESFPAVPRASGPVFKFCAPGLVFCGTAGARYYFMFCSPGYVFDGTEGVRSCFHVLLSRKSFRRPRGRHVPISCFALPDTFSTVRRASSPILMFCASGLIFDGTEGVRSRFHALRARTHFRRYRGRCVPFF